MSEQARNIAAGLAGQFTANVMAIGGRVSVRDSKGGDGLNGSATFDGGERMVLRVAAKPARTAKPKRATKRPAKMEAG
jgi:hypothetical protein